MVYCDNEKCCRCEANSEGVKCCCSSSPTWLTRFNDDLQEPVVACNNFKKKE